MFVSKTFCRHLQDMSSRHLQDMSSRCLQDMSSRHVFKTSSRHVFKTSSRLVFKMSSRRLQRNNFLSSETSSRRVCKTSWKTKNCYAEDVLKRSSRHVLKTSARPANVCWVVSYLRTCSELSVQKIFYHRIYL